jgi:hypothetical protein
MPCCTVTTSDMINNKVSSIQTRKIIRARTHLHGLILQYPDTQNYARAHTLTRTHTPVSRHAKLCARAHTYTYAYSYPHDHEQILQYSKHKIKHTYTHILTSICTVTTVAPDTAMSKSSSIQNAHNKSRTLAHTHTHTHTHTYTPASCTVTASATTMNKFSKIPESMAHSLSTSLGVRDTT